MAYRIIKCMASSKCHKNLYFKEIDESFQRTQNLDYLEKNSKYRTNTLTTLENMSIIRIQMIKQLQTSVLSKVDSLRFLQKFADSKNQQAVKNAVKTRCNANNLSKQYTNITDNTCLNALKTATIYALRNKLDEKIEARLNNKRRIEECYMLEHRENIRNKEKVDLQNQKLLTKKDFDKLTQLVLFRIDEKTQILFNIKCNDEAIYKIVYDQYIYNNSKIPKGLYQKQNIDKIKHQTAEALKVMFVQKQISSQNFDLVVKDVYAKNVEKIANLNNLDKPIHIQQSDNFNLKNKQLHMHKIKKLSCLEYINFTENSNDLKIKIETIQKLNLLKADDILKILKIVELERAELLYQEAYNELVHSRKLKETQHDEFNHAILCQHYLQMEFVHYTNCKIWIQKEFNHSIECVHQHTNELTFLDDIKKIQKNRLENAIKLINPRHETIV